MTQIISIYRKRKNIAYGKLVRDNPPSWERLTWKILREHGFQRRIFVAGFLVDFANRRNRIVIQISTPKSQLQRDEDAHADQQIRNAGYLVFRFRPDEIQQMGQVVLGNTNFEKSLADLRYKA